MKKVFVAFITFAVITTAFISQSEPNLKEIVAKAFLHFNLIKDAPKETIAYLKDKTNKLEKELKVTEEALRIMPRLSKVTAKLNRLTEEQKQRANRRNVLQFETIDRCLSEVESTIELLQFEI